MNLKTLFSIFVASFLLVALGYSQYSENDWKERDSWMNVSKIFELAGVEKGSIIADIGCHEGYLSMHLSEAVGENGKIFSVDVREDRLESLRENLKKRNIKNIQPILGAYDNPNLPENVLDIAFVIDTYHEIKEYARVLEHIKNSLKPNGRIIVLEKLKTRVRGKSRSEQISAHSLSSRYVKKELREAGFEITEEVSDFGNWQNNPDKKMWIVVGSMNGS